MSGVKLLLVASGIGVPCNGVAVFIDGVLLHAVIPLIDGHRSVAADRGDRQGFGLCADLIVRHGIARDFLFALDRRIILEAAARLDSRQDLGQLCAAAVAVPVESLAIIAAINASLGIAARSGVEFALFQHLMALAFLAGRSAYIRSPCRSLRYNPLLCRR